MGILFYLHTIFPTMHLANAFFSYILWDQQPEIFPNTSIPLRWYGLLFAAAFFVGQMVIRHIMLAEGKSEKDVESLSIHMIIATVVGARLGHCLFYQPEVYLANPIDILKVWEGGLASHGAAFAIIFAIWLYARKHPAQSWLWVLDRIVIVVALGGAFIRTGNLMNSEILGKPADSAISMVFPYSFRATLDQVTEGNLDELDIRKGTGADTTIDGQKWVPLELHFVFTRDKMQGSSVDGFLFATLPSVVRTSNGLGDHKEPHLFYTMESAQIRQGYDDKGRKTLTIRMFGLPRYPAMIFEAISSFLLFVALFLYWSRNIGRVPEGRMFSIFLLVLFSLRFGYEFLKENQVSFEDGLSLNMGQNLSIPLVLAGVFLLIRSFIRPSIPEKQE